MEDAHRLETARCCTRESISSTIDQGWNDSKLALRNWVPRTQADEGNVSGTECFKKVGLHSASFPVMSANWTTDIEHIWWKIRFLEQIPPNLDYLIIR